MSAALVTVVIMASSRGCLRCGLCVAISRTAASAAERVVVMSCAVAVGAVALRCCRLHTVSRTVASAAERVVVMSGAVAVGAVALRSGLCVAVSRTVASAAERVVVMSGAVAVGAVALRSGRGLHRLRCSRCNGQRGVSRKKIIFGNICVTAERKR